MYGGCGLILLFTLTLTKNSAETREIRPTTNFVTNIIVHHGRTKRELSSTRDVSGTHHLEIQLTVSVNGEQYLLDLRLNKDLLTREHTLQYQAEEKTVQKRPKIEELDLCHYTGSVRGKPNSLVAVSTCHGVRGVIHDGQTMRYIEPVRGSEIQSSHYLYDHKYINTSNSARQHKHDDDSHVSDLLNRINYQKDVKESHAVRHKRDTSKRIHVPYNANNESRYVEMVIVVDNAEFRANGADLRTVHSKVFQISNIAHTLYSQLNIYLALVGVVVWNEHDEIVIDNTIGITLKRFKDYRSKLALEMPSDAAFLLTKRDFDGKIMGLAYCGIICTMNEYSVAVITTADHDFIFAREGVASIIAHELGHILGMGHDFDFNDCKCPVDPCIMNGGEISSHWSTCSLASLAKMYQKGFDYCLRNKPTTLFNSPICGNGFVEPGEQCDCGTEAGVGGVNLCHACCHADTCTLRSNATCGAGTCCDITTCNIKPAGVVCRTANNECDLPEFCTGSSEYCPADEYRMDSTLCGEKKTV